MDDIVIKKVQEKDLKQILNILERVYGDRTKYQERFNYWWKLNPCMQPGIDKGWVATASSRIIGFLMNIPFRYIINGNDVVACGATQGYVDPEFRRKGIFRKLWLQFITQEIPVLFIGNTPVYFTRKLFAKLNFIALKKLYNRFECYFILEVLSFIKWFYRAKIRDRKFFVKFVLVLFIIISAPV
ncbi:MAG: GNAT family N-acetyltransferase, partial [bacterium]